MRKRFLLASSAAVMAVCVALGALPFVSSASAAESPAESPAEEIAVVEELTWEGTPTCGWGEVRKNLHCAGKALSIGGVGYDYNSIGTHLPGSDIPQDIVYDISDYSATYPYLTLGVGMPDGASNAAKFSVLVDDVVADSVVYTSGGGESPSPMTMRAYVKDAEKIALRLEWGGAGYADGACAFTDVRLQKETEGRTFANRTLSRLNTSATGYGFPGYGEVVMYDSQADNSAFDYMIYDEHLQFTEGLGLHLLNVPYATYEADKANAGNYVSMKWNIENKGYSYFNSLVYMQNGYGCHVDLWADGVELYTSGLINSVGTYAATGKDPRTAPAVVQAAIPEGAKEFEVRVVADTQYAEGQVNLLNPMFFEKSDKLVSYAAEQKAADIWAYQAPRTFMWDGKQTELYDAAADKNVVCSDGIFFIAGTSKANAAAYTFDISSLPYNTLSGVLGRAIYYPNHAEAKPVKLTAEVDYGEGKTETLESQGVDWTNSGLPVSYHWKEGAKTLTLYLVSENAAFSETVFASARFENKYSVTYDVNGVKESRYFDAGEALTCPEVAEKEGYEFLGFRLEGEEGIYDFTDKTALSDMAFTAVWKANVYQISYERKLGEREAETVSYEPTQYVYDTRLALPEAEAVEGYDFVGWYVGEEKVEALAAEKYTSDITVTAVYSLKHFSVTFKNGDDVVDSQDVAFGALVSDVQAPAKVGYTFGGWKTDGGEIFDVSTPVSSDLTLSAVWTAKEFNIAYKQSLGGSESAADGYSPAKHVYGADTALPAGKQIEGYTFLGWFVDGKEVTALGGTDYLEDIVAVAKYRIVTLTVTFVSDGENFEVAYDYGKTVSAKQLEKDGYTLKGWYTDAECRNAYDFSAPLKSDLKLYAAWEKNTESGCGSVIGAACALPCLAAALAVVFGKRKKR